MKLWIAYVLGCFMLGIVLWKQSNARRDWILIGLCLAVCFGYFVLHQI